MLQNKTIHGFEFFSSREIPELSGALHEAVYKKNGAKLLFIDRPDTNKTFAITFKTIPSDDTGVFHILEHSVLCGSEKYPVKEPFVALLKGSLKTFLNAYTFPDKTMYPVSSRNEKDFLNLIDVYMDAVLHPLAVKDKRIFMQEGWHVEDENGGSYKGVVFNEMKGAYSSADEVEMQQMCRLLFGSNCYGYDSGGDPVSITSLTYPDFVSAHETYYHPSNARIILDGEVDLEKTLALLDSYLSEYDRKEINTDIPRAEKAHSEKTVEYEIAPGESTEGRARLCLGFAAGDFSERRRIAALSIIVDAIAGTNEAPLKRAMLNSGLLEDMSFISYDGVMENAAMIEIKNINEKDIPAAEQLLMKTLAEIAERGIDREALRASYNIFEFRLREQDMGSSPAGVSFAISALDTWLYGGDPMDSLSFFEDLDALRDLMDTDYYENLIKEIFLTPTHSARLVMLPSATLGERRLEGERERLFALLGGLTEKEREEIRDECRRLVAWQNEPDSDEALLTLPALSLDDVAILPEKIDSEITSVEGVETLYTEVASRGITYMTMLFDASDLTGEELSYASLVSDLMKNLGTDKRGASELQNAIKSELGQLSFSLRVARRGDVVTPYFQVTVSCLDSKRDSARELVLETLFGTDFSDSSAIGKIVKQIKTASAESIAQSIPFGRASAMVSTEAAVAEYIDGVENHLWLKQLDSDFGNKKEELSRKLSLIRDRLFTKKRFKVCIAGTRADTLVGDIARALPEGDSVRSGTSITPFGAGREGLLVPSGIAYTALAGCTKDPDSCMHGSLSAVRSILSYGYLWGEIRVAGGAYGAGFIKRLSGVIGCYSYRDPDPARSLERFLACPDQLRAIAESGEDITDFIIGAVGDIDPIMTPKVKAGLAIGSYLRGETYEDRVKLRRELLETDKEDLLMLADIIEKAFSSSASVVTAGKDKLDALRSSLDRIIEI